MDMPFRLDHLGKISLYKEAINWVDTAAHSAIKMRLQDQQDFLIPMERTKYERTEAAITREKDKLRKAQEFFAIHNERCGHEFASSASDNNTNLVLRQSPLIGHSSTFILRGYQKIM